MNSTTGDELFGDVLAATAAHQRVGLEGFVQHIKQRLGVDVEYRDGRVIRSKRGEPARRETGELQASIQGDVVVLGDQAEAAAFSDSDHAEPLETTLGRLVMTDQIDEFETLMTDAAVRGVEGD